MELTFILFIYTNHNLKPKHVVNLSLCQNVLLEFFGNPFEQSFLGTHLNSNKGEARETPCVMCG